MSMETIFTYGGVIIVIGLCVISFFYREYVIDTIKKYTVQLYLGKPTEIHATKIPEDSNLNSLYENMDMYDNDEI
jgi:hypothetical protein